MSTRTLVAALFGVLAVLASTYTSFAATKFTPAALAEAQKSGKPILVEVSAPWCSTCKAQKVVLSKLSQDARFKDFVLLEVDFDSQKEDVRALNAIKQSTLIVYKGDKEVARSVGVSDAGAIEALLSKAL